jgi:hypothetical protein
MVIYMFVFTIIMGLLTEKSNWVKMEGQKILEGIITLGPKGTGFGFTLPDSQMEALATYFKCAKSEVPSRMKGKIWMIFPSDGETPFFALTLQKGGEKNE